MAAAVFWAMAALIICIAGHLNLIDTVGITLAFAVFGAVPSLWKG
jgi:hypothetical protein